MEAALRLAMAAAGLGLALAALWLGWMNRRSARWPSVVGVVVRSAADEFVYRFEVGGIAHEVGRVAYAARWPAPPVPRRLVERCPVGHRVTVFYDPACPSSAVIERGADSHTAALALAGATLASAVGPALAL
jgi:Protein of unknown function (DUF3592)